MNLALAALALFAVDCLLLKFTHPLAGLLPLDLALMFALALVIRARARRLPEPHRHALDRLWASMDGEAIVWLVFLFVLLTVFHYGFVRASGDGREYFAQLRSAFIDHDLNFSDENRDFGTHDVAIFPFGSAILWMPFYLLAHLWLGVLNLFGAGFSRNGYIYPYQMAIGLGSMAYGFAGLVLIYRVTCEYFAKRLALAATLVVATGSFIVWYLTVDNSYTHGNSLFAVTLFLFLWHRTRAARSPAAWGWLGLSGGLMVMVRWQNAVFLAPLALDAIAALWHVARRRDRDELVRTVQNLALASAGFLAGFLPQMYFWKVVNGAWLGVPHGQAGQQWWHDALMLDVLFSPNHGLFAWHPVLYLSVLGTPLFVRRDRYLGSLLLALFAAQVYVNGAVATWWGGSAFGGRRFDGCAMLFVLGLAALFHWSLKRPAVVWGGVLGTLLVGNVFFMRDVHSGRLPMGEGIGIDQIVGATTSRIGNPFSFPANALFAWRVRSGPTAYDRLGLKLYNQVMIDVGEPGDERFLINGWADAERGADGSFRWAVSNESTLAVALIGERFLQPGEPMQLPDYVLRMRAAPFEFPEHPPQTLSAEVNAHALGIRTIEPGFHDYEFDVPHTLLSRNLNVLTFRYGYARAPQALGLGRDSRTLAVRFDTIHFVQKTRPEQ